MKLNKELMENLYEGSIRIENVFHMELVTACDSMPESFWEVFNSDHEDVLEVLGLRNKDISEYGDLESKSELLEFFHDCRLTGFLIHFSTPVPRNFLFGDDGEFRGCSSGWGISTWRFAFGLTLVDALNEAVKMQKKYFDLCIVEARKEMEELSNDASK